LSSNKKIDLHLHSNCSDGSYSPSQLVHKLSNAGLKAFALTDHDTIKGLDEAAISAIKKTRFKPAKQRDRDVGVWIAIPVVFRLK